MSTTVCRGERLLQVAISTILICESYIWDIRRRLAQRAILTNAILVPPVSLTKGGGPYVELFLIYAFPFV